MWHEFKAVVPIGALEDYRTVYAGDMTSTEARRCARDLSLNRPRGILPTFKGIRLYSGPGRESVTFVGEWRNGRQVAL